MKRFDLAAFVERMREKGFRPGFAEDRDLPFVVTLSDLSRARLGDHRFEIESRERKAWCERECESDWDVVPIRDEVGRLVGREFRFAEVGEALMFFIRFQQPPLIYG